MKFSTPTLPCQSSQYCAVSFSCPWPCRFGCLSRSSNYRVVLVLFFLVFLSVSNACHIMFIALLIRGGVGELTVLSLLKLYLSYEKLTLVILCCRTICWLTGRGMCMCLACSLYYFRCVAGGKCLSQYYLCNGRCDCPYCTDELSCPPFLPSTTTPPWLTTVPPQKNYSK